MEETTSTKTFRVRIEYGKTDRNKKKNNGYPQKKAEIPEQEMPHLWETDELRWFYGKSKKS